MLLTSALVMNDSGALQRLIATVVRSARCRFNWPIIAVIRSDMRKFVAAAVILTLKRPFFSEKK